MTNREIDALVAERVMGWRPCIMPRGSTAWALDRASVSESGHWIDGEWIPLAEFRPSRSPTADYQVLQHVRETWDQPALEAMAAELRDIVSSRWTGSGDMELMYQPGDWSRAALRALGVEVDGE